MRRFPFCMTLIPDTDIAKYATAAGFPASEVVTAVAVALAESDGESTATHKNSDEAQSTDYGLWQINKYWNPGCFALGDWRDPKVNAKMALVVWKQQGWKGWSTFKSGSYKKYLDRAKAAVKPSKPPVKPSYTLNRVLFLAHAHYMKGDDVTHVQKVVGASVDGAYGPNTATAVGNYQSAHNLTVDGVVGPQTAASFGWAWGGE